jgi:hypothetical protein
MTTTDKKTQQIAQLNDELRSQVGMPIFGKNQRGTWRMTQGIECLPPMDIINIWMEVRNFSNFNQDNDPYGEHDFGAFNYNGSRILWKIDYYNGDMTAHSPDPSDFYQTVRVLTIMLAHEY